MIVRGSTSISEAPWKHGLIMVNYVDVEQFCQDEFGQNYKNGSGDERMYRCVW
jgi:hypothetical protein